MAIHITYENGSNIILYSIKDVQDKVIIENVVKVLIGGVILEEIIEPYSIYLDRGNVAGYSIPVHSKKGSMFFYGDIAKTILANL